MVHKLKIYKLHFDISAIAENEIEASDIVWNALQKSKAYKSGSDIHPWTKGIGNIDRSDHIEIQEEE